MKNDEMTSQKLVPKLCFNSWIYHQTILQIFNQMWLVSRCVGTFITSRVNKRRVEISALSHIRSRQKNYSGL